MEKEWESITGVGDNNKGAILDVSEENLTTVNRAHELSLSPPTLLHLCTASHMSCLFISLSFTLADGSHLSSPADQQLTEKISPMLDI